MSIFMQWIYQCSNCDIYTIYKKLVSMTCLTRSLLTHSLPTRRVARKSLSHIYTWIPVFHCYFVNYYTKRWCFFITSDMFLDALRGLCIYIYIDIVMSEGTALLIAIRGFISIAEQI